MPVYNSDESWQDQRYESCAKAVFASDIQFHRVRVPGCSASKLSSCTSTKTSEILRYVGNVIKRGLEAKYQWSERNKSIQSMHFMLFLGGAL
jgi:hypothetical protein